MTKKTIAVTVTQENEGFLVHAHERSRAGHQLLTDIVERLEAHHQVSLEHKRVFGSLLSFKKPIADNLFQEITPDEIKKLAEAIQNHKAQGKTSLPQLPAEPAGPLSDEHKHRLLIMAKRGVGHSEKDDSYLR